MRRYVNILYTSIESIFPVRREVLYNIASEFGMPIKTAALIESCSNKNLKPDSFV